MIYRHYIGECGRKLNQFLSDNDSVFYLNRELRVGVNRDYFFKLLFDLSLADFNSDSCRLDGVKYRIYDFDENFISLKSKKGIWIPETGFKEYEILINELFFRNLSFEGLEWFRGVFSSEPAEDFVRNNMGSLENICLNSKRLHCPVLPSEAHSLNEFIDF